MKKSLVSTGIAAAALAVGISGFGLNSALAQDAPAEDGTEEAPDGECNGRRGHRGEALAEAIGIETEALRDALESGQTPAEVAEDNGVSRDELVDALVTAMNERLEAAVADGHLTQEEADEKAADTEERANAIADGERPERPEGFDGPRGPGGPADAEQEDAVFN